MRNATRATLSVILVVCILASSLGAFALENSPRIVQSSMGSHIDSIGAGLTITTSGYTTCTSSLELSNTTDTGTTYMYLQRMVNSVWTNYDSWTCSGSIFFAQTSHDYVPAGYYYRVHVVANVYASGTLVDTATQNSNTVYYS